MLSLPGGQGASIWAKENQRRSDFPFQGEKEEDSPLLLRLGEEGSALHLSEKVKAYRGLCTVQGDAQEQELAETRHRGSKERCGVSTASQILLRCGWRWLE